MAMEQKLQLRMSQKLIMTPSLQQAIKLLQMSKLDLVAEINHELEENPALEERNLEGSTEDPPAETEETSGEPEKADDFDFDAYFQNYLDTDYYMVFKQEGKTEIQGQVMDIETDLGDYKELCLETSVLVDDENACDGAIMVLPYSIESKPKGAPSGQAITITGVHVNPDDIAEDYFAMPASEAGDEAGE